jgi:hypothetical protein
MDSRIASKQKQNTMADYARHQVFSSSFQYQRKHKQNLLRGTEKNILPIENSKFVAY